MRPRLAVLALLLPVLVAAKLDRIEKMQAAGEHAEVVAQIDEWKAKGALGKEEAALLDAQAKSAYALAMADGHAKALHDFRAAYKDHPLCAEALKREYDLAFSEAQADGTAAAMGAYREAYPDSPYAARAAAMQQGWAYEDVVAEGTIEALDRFLAVAGDSPYRATAWEAVAAKQPGVSVLDATGRPQLLPAVTVADGRIEVPATLAKATSHLTFAVNVEGAGRGDTSEWFGLRHVGPEGELSEALPVEAWLAKQLGVEVALPHVRELVATPGAHTARVATAAQPLLLPGECQGTDRFAFVLAQPGSPATAWPFEVDCPTAAGDAALDQLAVSLQAAATGDRAAADAAWDRFAGAADGAPIVAALRTALNADDPRAALFDTRPAAGDVLAWAAQDGVVETVWLHPDGTGAPRVLARRPELVLAGSGRLVALRRTEEPWTVPAGCKPVAMLAGAELDTVGGEGHETLFPDAAGRLAGAAARTITPIGSVGPLLVVEEQAAPATCKGKKATFAPGFAVARAGYPDDAVAHAIAELLAAPAIDPATLPAAVAALAEPQPLVARFREGQPAPVASGWTRVEGDAAAAFAAFSAP